ncbi:MAG: GGDEF domain-containing protein [Piscirickettsiaceae bacterium]|nr:GGDEF domain-containing protein [Piscirickettsiaceae bacterium]
MANDDIQQQLDEWKQKYYQSITNLEQQQSFDQLLRRSLARLALASQGLDPLLDKQLKALRKILRSNNDPTEISHILEQMEKAIAQMDTKVTDNSQATGEVLANLLHSLKLAKPFKSEARKLSKQLKSSTNNQITSLMPEVLLLLNSSLEINSAKNLSRGFGFHLFGIGKSPKINDEQAPAEISMPFTSDEEAMPAHFVLMKLLEQLSLPVDLSKSATKIRHQIETGIEPQQLPEIINNIADIVNALGSQVIMGKQEYEDFLITMTSRLKALDQYIRETGEENAKAFKYRHTIGQSVEDEVKGLRDHVADAQDLEQLKSSVNDRLDFLNQNFENYRQSDYERFDKSQQQISTLNNRLQSMEQESQVLRESAEKSRDLALRDALTGIWNRQALNEVLEKEYARWQRYQSPLSIVLWDIDLFKRVNDTYGHSAGDKVLQTIAHIFQKETRGADFIARYGGEEFMGIFPETRLEDALRLANKIREKVANSKFHYENKPVPITASAGLATFRPNDTIDDVFKRADEALYRAKDNGRNRCYLASD